MCVCMCVCVCLCVCAFALACVLCVRCVCFHVGWFVMFLYVVVYFFFSSVPRRTENLALK